MAECHARSTVLALGCLARFSYAVCRKSRTIAVLCLSRFVSRSMDLFFNLQCYGAAFCVKVNSIGSVYVQVAMETCGDPDRYTSSLALAIYFRTAKATRSYSMVHL